MPCTAETLGSAAFHKSLKRKKKKKKKPSFLLQSPSAVAITSTTAAAPALRRAPNPPLFQTRRYDAAAHRESESIEPTNSNYSADSTHAPRSPPPSRDLCHENLKKTRGLRYRSLFPE
ncbi:hypothetical protein HPP92_011857 [Vanilla planifolia]|uniref:Uncharacterized protein n=1 Tax=Vanilla planifolia TaxID=51239 RepID=A0A835UYU8_VANPL|nr:hypothetical protein HPP92_011857 [Vanilla planifolia]